MKAWVDSLRIAIIEEDMDKLVLLSQNIPQTDDIDLAKEASVLIEESIKLAKHKKMELSKEMAKLKAAKNYLR